MNLDIEQIKELIHSQDVLGLCELLESALKQGPPDTDILRDALWEVLGLWQYDIDCHKGGDPNDYPYLEGLLAIEALGEPSENNFNFNNEKATYFSMCMHYRIEEGNLQQAREFAKEVEKFSRLALKEASGKERAYSQLVSLFENYPSLTSDESAQKLVESLSLLNEAILTLKDPQRNFYLTKILLLFARRKKDDTYRHPLVRDLFSQERKAFLELCTQKTSQDPLFAFSMAHECQRFWDAFDRDFSNQLEAFVLHLLESTKLLLKSSASYSAWDVGHVFRKFGSYLKSPDLIETAEHFYEKAGPESNWQDRFSRDLAEAREIRAKLLMELGETTKALSLRESICEGFWDTWRRHKESMGFLFDAAEYILVHHSKKFSPQQLQDLLQIALISENLGKGYYWEPFDSLFWIYLLMGNETEAFTWLGRGYLSLNIYTPDRLNKILMKLEADKNIKAAEFVRNLLKHLDSVAVKTMFYGGPPRERLLNWNLQDIEKQLLFKDFNWSSESRF